MSRAASIVEQPLAQLFAPALGLPSGVRRLDRRRILVVGAGQREDEGGRMRVGNGRAMAVLLAREGASLICLDRDAKAAHASCEWIREEGGNAHALCLNVEDVEGIASGVAEACGVFGGLDGMVVNVGVTTPNGLAEETPQDWDRVLAINLRAHVFFSQAAMARMDEGASIVLIGSTAGLHPRGRMPAYEASKAALVSLGRSIALAGQERAIRSNVLAPGIIDTPMGRSEERDKPWRAASGAGALPFGRQGTPWEVAHAALFLLSHESSYVNGQLLVVDGGLAAGVVRPQPVPQGALTNKEGDFR